jgi:single-strand DNA-binding protein
MLNCWNGVGRLTKDPEIRSIKGKQEDQKVANFTIAVNRPFKDESGERTADFIQCQAWGKQAEFMEKFVVKGQLVAVTGSIRTRDWKDDEGKMHYVTEVNVDMIQSLEKREPQTEDQIRKDWTAEWDRRSQGMDAKGKAALKRELEGKYQPKIDALKNQAPAKIEDDLPY